jgi:uncharacterized protein (DUF486 family)
MVPDPTDTLAAMNRALAAILLLVGSNVFMTTAWYYHLKHSAGPGATGGRTHWPLWMAIGISWMIALPEYCLQVPANRAGHIGSGGPFTLPQLKILQEAITLLVFTGFTIVVMHEKPRVNDAIAFLLIFAAVAVSFVGRK